MMNILNDLSVRPESDSYRILDNLSTRACMDLLMGASVSLQFQLLQHFRIDAVDRALAYENLGDIP